MTARTNRSAWWVMGLRGGNLWGVRGWRGIVWTAAGFATPWPITDFVEEAIEQLRQQGALDRLEDNSENQKPPSTGCSMVLRTVRATRFSRFQMILSLRTARRPRSFRQR